MTSQCAWAVGQCLAIAVLAKSARADDAQTPAGTPPPSVEGAGTIKVTLEGVRNADGQMRILLFDSAKGFPGDPKPAVKALRLPAQKGSMTVTLEGVRYGTYAIAVLHDENGNGKMDTGFFGIPTEGGGASNDAPARFGPPKFEDARFQLAVPELRLRITVRYP